MDPARRALLSFYCAPASGASPTFLTARAACRACKATLADRSRGPAPPTPRASRDLWIIGGSPDTTRDQAGWPQGFTGRWPPDVWLISLG